VWVKIFETIIRRLEEVLKHRGVPLPPDHTGPLEVDVDEAEIEPELHA
jgi:hypothetical protein